MFFRIFFSGILHSKLLRRSQSPSPTPTPDSIRRHNSAPNTSESEDDVAAAAAAAAASLLSAGPGGGGGGAVARTRSSTCLEDLVQENAAARLEVKVKTHHLFDHASMGARKFRCDEQTCVAVPSWGKLRHSCPHVVPGSTYLVLAHV